MDVPDGENLGWVAKIGLAAIGFLTMTGTVFFGSFKILNGRIAAVDKKVDGKADRERVESISKNLAESFRNQRQDKNEILAAISAMNHTMSGLHANIIDELGKRPTREELRK